MPTSELQAQLMRALYDEHAGALWSYCLHLTRGTPGRAEDVAQETLLRAWQHPAVLDRSPTQTRAWLFRVAHNLVIDEWRRSSTRPAIATDPQEMHDRVEDVTDQLLQSWLVADALRSLSAEHRTALVECYYGGRTVPDAAQHLGVPEGTVKSRLHYGLRALRLALAERGVTE